MKGTSKVIMGATLVMVVTLAVVLGLIFVLLAELYCSLLLRRRHLRNSNSNTIPTTQSSTTRANAQPSHTTSHPQPHSPPFSSIYAQGVFQAPSSILLPAVSCKEDKAGPRKHHSEPPQLVQIQTQTQESKSNANPCQVAVLPASSPPPSFISIAPSKPNHQSPLPSQSLCCDDKPCSGGEHHLVYISNPIYESQGSGANTPFETPDTSPSRFEKSGSSEEDEAEAPPSGNHSPPYTPPLTPMKKLPAEACSVSLRDARSLGTSGSDSHSNNGLSTSSSASPCTSPSWRGYLNGACYDYNAKRNNALKVKCIGKASEVNSYKSMEKAFEMPKQFRQLLLYAFYHLA
ncbi:hypothetical protein VNO77_00248 [Canavalia gladiata]|uniref:Uncharacterized protein n=1 Tax=Canavalia gladiata TaxID=3824 RepID=A0AAN9MPP9_CANGL